MSALEWDERQIPSSVLYYAPRRPRRAADASSIRPILDRLNRAEGAYPRVETVPLMPNDEPIGEPDMAVARKRVPLIAARVAAVTGLCIGVGVIVVFSLPAPQRDEQMPQREDRAALPATQMPKPVRTVSFKSQAGLTDREPVSAAETNGEALRDTAQDASAQADGNAVLPAALQSWAAVPPALSLAGWMPAAQTSFGAVEPKAAAHERHQHHLRRRHVAHPAATQMTDGKARVAHVPADNPLQAALHKILGTQ